MANWVLSQVAPSRSLDFPWGLGRVTSPVYLGYALGLPPPPSLNAVLFTVLLSLALQDNPIGDWELESWFAVEALTAILPLTGLM